MTSTYFASVSNPPNTSSCFGVPALVADDGVMGGERGVEILDNDAPVLLLLLLLLLGVVEEGDERPSGGRAVVSGISTVISSLDIRVTHTKNIEVPEAGHVPPAASTSGHSGWCGDCTWTARTAWTTNARSISKSKC
jgi:hypothetical protein